MHELTVDRAQSIVRRAIPGHELVSVKPTPGSFTNDARILECRTPAGTLERLVVKFLIDEPEEASRCAAAGFRALGLAQAHGVRVPEPIFVDEVGDALGVPGIVTRFVEGRQVWNPRDTAMWAKGLARLLLKIHAIRPDYEDQRHLFNGLDEGLHMLRDDWSQRKIGHPLSVEILGALRELRSTIMPVRSVLIHMDYWHGNVLWHEDGVSAVVDWDFASYGDPAIDVAYFRLNQYLRGTKSAADLFLKFYEEGSGESLRNLGFWELAAAARPLPQPTLWVRQIRKVAGITATDEQASSDYHEFVASALKRAYKRS